MRVSKLLTNLLTTAFIVAISGLITSPVKTEATETVQERSPDSSQDKKLDFSGDGRPGRRKGGGSRSPCPSTKMPLTAIVPARNIGTTVSDRPSLWFYVPYSPQQVSAGEFVLQDEQENDVYRQTFTLPKTKTPGLVNFQIPQAAPPLAVNQSYRWYFKLYCGDSPLATANFVEGWIKRVYPSPDLISRLKKKKTSAYKEYENDLIWFDSLDNLARSRFNNDNPQLQLDWAKLLSATGIDLNELIQKPFVGKVINTTQDNL